MEKIPSWFKRHPIWTAILVILAIGFVVSLIKGDSSTRTSDVPQVNTVNRDYSNSDPIVEERTEKIKINTTFSGNTDMVTDPIYLDGLVFFKARYNGDSNFIVDVIDENGDKSLLFNEIGAYSGTKSAKFATGSYRLNVEIGSSYTGDGFSSTAPWNIEITN